MKKSIELTEEQRSQLEEIVSNGCVSARTIQHAHILLKADNGQWGPGWTDNQIKEAFGVSAATIWRVRHRFLEQGPSDALNRREQSEKPDKRKMIKKQEEQMITLACTEAPTGYT